jgi:hypothetical protein
VISAGYRFTTGVNGEAVRRSGLKRGNRCSGPLVVGIGVTALAPVSFHQLEEGSSAGNRSGLVKVARLIVAPDLANR